MALRSFQDQAGRSGEKRGEMPDVVFRASALPRLLERFPDQPGLLDRRLQGELLESQRGLSPAGETVKQIVGFFAFESFGAFHDTCLRTDLVLGDVMERYRDTFWDNFHLDPCQYVTNASASHDAMLRKCCFRRALGLGLMTDRRVYELTKANIRGGLGHIAQPFAVANHPMLPSFDRARERSWILFYVNSVYPSIMEKRLPTDGGQWVELAASKKERLRYLNLLFDQVDYKRDDEEVCYTATWSR